MSLSLCLLVLMLMRPGNRGDLSREDVCIYVCRSVRVSVWLSVRLSACLSLTLIVCISVDSFRAQGEIQGQLMYVSCTIAAPNR